jgi:hypothetical protein
MWMYLHTVQIEIDDGRRAWVSAYNGVKKQAEELERKKKLLLNYRDTLAKLEAQLPELENNLQQEADALYKRRKAYDDKLNEMKKERDKFYHTKIDLVDWARRDDKEYDTILRKPNRKKHAHHAHHGPPHMVHPPNNWDSPISTPESQLDDSSYVDTTTTAPYVGMDLDDGWGMGYPTKVVIPLHGAPGPSSAALANAAAAPGGVKKKNKGKGVVSAGIPPLPGPEELVAGMPVDAKAMQKLMNVSGNASSTSTASASPSVAAVPPPSDGPLVGV